MSLFQSLCLSIYLLILQHVHVSLWWNVLAVGLLLIINCARLSKPDSFSAMYKEKGHCCFACGSGRGSLRTLTHVEKSSFLALDSKSADLLRDLPFPRLGRLGISSSSSTEIELLSSRQSSMYRDSGVELLLGRESLLFPACMTGIRNYNLSQYIHVDL